MFIAVLSCREMAAQLQLNNPSSVLPPPLGGHRDTGVLNPKSLCTGSRFRVAKDVGLRHFLEEFPYRPGPGERTARPCARFPVLSAWLESLVSRAILPNPFATAILFSCGVDGSEYLAAQEAPNCDAAEDVMRTCRHGSIRLVRPRSGAADNIVATSCCLRHNRLANSSLLLRSRRTS